MNSRILLVALAGLTIGSLAACGQGSLESPGAPSLPVTAAKITLSGSTSSSGTDDWRKAWMLEVQKDGFANLETSALAASDQWVWYVMKTTGGTRVAATAR
jgi:hypothetical protein